MPEFLFFLPILTNEGGKIFVLFSAFDWREEEVNLHIEEPPTTLDLGESGFGVGYLSLLTTCPLQTSVLTVVSQ